MSEGLVIPTWEVPDGVPGVCMGPVLEHEPIRFVSYVFEWPFALLKQAALLHLHLLQHLIPAGFILSDATPSNVMFRGTRPVFIDMGSVVLYEPGTPWRGYKQLLETMLYPLLLTAHKGVSYCAWLRGAGEEGLRADQIAKLFGWSDIFKPGVLAHITLSAALEHLDGSRFEITQAEIRSAGVPTAVLLRTLSKLEHLIRPLKSPLATAWLDYDADCYGPAGRDLKRAAVAKAAASFIPDRGVVWDVGCNNGDYSFLVADAAALVVAMDRDESVAEALCHRCEETGVHNVLPLVVDVANPSPAQGWRGKERRSLMERGRPDLLLALALIHHLVLTRNLPVEQILEEFASWAPYCLLEYVAPDDPMAVKLSRNAGDGRNLLPDRAAFDAGVQRCFDIHDSVRLTETRTLYVLGSRREAT